MSSSDDHDEFDAYDFSEFTEEDLRKIDAPLTHKKHFSVTDLVSPIWCEVQYEYNLYGHRNKPLHLRPPTFTAKSGKQISVRQRVAQANDRRLKRGKSVHKALQDELCPEKTIVHTVSEEERFGLRFVQLIDGFTQLVVDGITRELPVFTITHGHVVLGIIDEVLRSTCDSYELRILDYKTRRSSTIPVDQDALSSRLQLMMYHRMLSSLLHPEAFDFNLLWSRLNLEPTKPFSPQFLIDIAWQQRQTDPADNLHLNRLVSEWFTTVQRRRPLGVSRHLQLVYRRSSSPGKQPNNPNNRTPEPVDIEDPLESLILQEDLDLARAIQDSLCEMGHQQINQVVDHLAQNDIQLASSSVVWDDLVSSDSDRSDPTLAWAIQQSLLTCAHKVYNHVPANKSQQSDIKQDDLETNSVLLSSGQVQNGATVDISPIIGTREFSMDDHQLDAHLTDVLQWWSGARPARGVDVGQTNRCFTCEYQDSCEWREQKAKEALERASERRGQESNINSIWPTTRPDNINV